MNQGSTGKQLAIGVVAVFVLPLLLLLAIPTVLMRDSGEVCDPSGGAPVVAGDVVFPLPEGTWYKSDDRKVRPVHPVTGATNVWHAGTDYAAPSGTPVMAVAAGRVVTAEYMKGLGNFILLEHQFDSQMIQTGYAHLRDGGILVEVGQEVTAGQLIGEVGSTGGSSGPHLHLEIRPDGATGGGTLDSVEWLAANGALSVTEATEGSSSAVGAPCVPATASGAGGELVELAAAQIGKPYVWGAAGPDSFDCSGLVYWSLAQMGIQAPRVADDQAKFGEEVWSGTCSALPEDQLAPGDLIAFASNHSYYQHIGIYSGPGKMIHAPVPGKTVEYQSIPGYWSNQKCMVRRVLTESSSTGSSTSEYTLADLKFQGVINWGGTKFTYYSQSVLPGGGLTIPGRHINSAGFVADSSGNIVLAAPAGIAHGKIYQTPFGSPGKVYDTCASCTSSPLWLDVYTK